MALKIIKPGTSRALSVQRFAFAENSGEPFTQFEESSFPEIPPAVTVAPKNPVPEHVPHLEVDVAQLEKAAFEKGFLEGEKTGYRKAEEKIEAVMKRYAESITEVGSLRSFLHGQVEREAVRLALEVAKKIVHREIQVDKDIIRTLVRVALTHVAEKSAVTIHLNPVDYGYLLEQRAELSQTEGRDISLLADQSIERGGCVIQTECGDVDARIEEKFREVEKAFFGGCR